MHSPLAQNIYCDQCNPVVVDSNS